MAPGTCATCHNGTSAKGKPTNVTFDGPALKGAKNVVLMQRDHREVSFHPEAFALTYEFITGRAPATLAVTPLRVLLGWPELLRFRRLLGLLTFGYASLHLLGYAWFDMGLDWADIVRDIPKRPFVLIGTLAFVLLLCMAATSWNGAIRRLGARRWQLLHRSVYAVAMLAILHFWWMRAGKQNFGEVWVYGLILAALLGWRLWRRMHRP